MDGAERIRVMIVDDHPMVRQGLRMFLSTCDDNEVAGEATNGHEAVQSSAELEPDVILMDMVMPGVDGATATAEILSDRPNSRVIALTSFVEPDTVRRHHRLERCAGPHGRQNPCAGHHG